MMEKSANGALAVGTLKRKRLTTACNRCRSRKLRCDDRLPSCTNCQKTSSECITQDPRQPYVEVERREAQSLAHSPLKSTASRNRSQSISATADAHLRAASTEALPETGSARPRYYHEATVGLFSGPLPAIPIFLSGNCLFMLTQWLDLAFARIGLPERFSWKYKAERVKLTDHGLGGGHFQTDIGPWTIERPLELNTFLSNMNLVFPLVEPEDTVRSPVTQPETTIAERTRPTAGSIMQHLVLAAGSTVVAGSGEIDKSFHILAFAFSNLTTLVQDESIDSVKALLLMALLFRNRNDTEMAWRMLAAAVPKAQALALDRCWPAHRRSQETRAIHRQQANTWWSLFILDKVLALELQRPPMVRDCFYDQELFTDSDGSREAQTKKTCFAAIVNLARIQGQICERLLLCTQDEESGKYTLGQAIRAKIQTAGEVDQLLLDWVKLLPEDLK